MALSCKAMKFYRYVVILMFIQNFSIGSPVKLPQDCLIAKETDVVASMNKALTGNLDELNNIRKFLFFTPMYQEQGVGAPYTESPHQAEKMLILFTIIGALLENEYLLQELRYAHSTYPTLDLTQEENTLMNLFLLNEKERQYYIRLLEKNPNSLYINYFLYMDAQLRGNPSASKYMRHMRNRIDNRLINNKIHWNNKTSSPQLIKK